MKFILNLLWAKCVMSILSLSILSISINTQAENDQALRVKAFDLPLSALMSEESKAVLKQQAEQAKRDNYYKKVLAKCGAVDTVELANLPDVRRCRAEAFYQSKTYKNLIERYDVVVTPSMIGGVYTEVFTPTDGVADTNENRVLINFHGGSFKRGSRIKSHIESIPIAALGKIRVISVDYRLAPEHHFPAASEDVASVYRELLKRYKPENIGLYGGSAGGILTAQSMAWFQQEKLPLPGAIGMFFGAASKLDGDTMHIVGALEGRDWLEYVEQGLNKGD